MNINNFIDPVEETQALEKELENIIKHIVTQFGPEWDAETDEKDIKLPKIKISKAIAVLQQLQLYEEQQDEDDSCFLSILNKYKQQVQDKRIKERQQIPITAFFNAAECQENLAIAIFWL